MDQSKEQRDANSQRIREKLAQWKAKQKVAIIPDASTKPEQAAIPAPAKVDKAEKEMSEFDYLWKRVQEGGVYAQIMKTNRSFWRGWWQLHLKKGDVAGAAETAHRAQTYMGVEWSARDMWNLMQDVLDNAGHVHDGPSSNTTVIIDSTTTTITSSTFDLTTSISSTAAASQVDAPAAIGTGAGADASKQEQVQEQVQEQEQARTATSPAHSITQEVAAVDDEDVAQNDAEPMIDAAAAPITPTSHVVEEATAFSSPSYIPAKEAPVQVERENEASEMEQRSSPAAPFVEDFYPVKPSAEIIAAAMPPIAVHYTSVADGPDLSMSAATDDGNTLDLSNLGKPGWTTAGKIDRSPAPSPLKQHPMRSPWKPPAHHSIPLRVVTPQSQRKSRVDKSLLSASRASNMEGGSVYMFSPIKAKPSQASRLGSDMLLSPCRRSRRTMTPSKSPKPAPSPGHIQAVEKASDMPSPPLLMQDLLASTNHAFVPNPHISEDAMSNMDSTRDSLNGSFMSDAAHQLMNHGSSFGSSFGSLGSSVGSVGEKRAREEEHPADESSATTPLRRSRRLSERSLPATPRAVTWPEASRLVTVTPKKQ